MGIFHLFRKKSRQKFTHDKVEYQWEDAVEEYCNIHGITQDDLDLDDLDTEVEDEIWGYAGNHLAFFVVWLVKHDFIAESDYFAKEELDSLKEESMDGVAFLMEYCDGTLARDFLKEEILDFVDDYYEDGSYFGDYCAFVEDTLQKTVLGTSFSWKEYHQFEPVLDRAYRNFQR